jgi:hypothetical protein
VVVVVVAAAAVVVVVVVAVVAAAAVVVVVVVVVCACVCARRHGTQLRRGRQAPHGPAQGRGQRGDAGCQRVRAWILLIHKQCY